MVALPWVKLGGTVPFRKSFPIWLWVRAGPKENLHEILKAKLKQQQRLQEHLHAVAPPGSTYCLTVSAAPPSPTSSPPSTVLSLVRQVQLHGKEWQLLRQVAQCH